MQRKEDSLQPHVNTILAYFHLLFKKGSSHSTICSARAALAHILTLPGYNSISEHPLIQKYVRGIYNKKPTLPRYVEIWDINEVLTYYYNMPGNENLTFFQISRKLVMLLSILGMQRKQTLQSIDRVNAIILKDKAVLLPNKSLKTTKVSNPLKPIVYDEFHIPKLCVVSCLSTYFKSRNKLVNDSIQELIITSRPPYRKASGDTIARWLKFELKLAGIDIKVFKAHSTRAAASSKAQQSGFSVNDIIKRAGWKSESTFIKHYSKHIIQNN